MLFTNYVSPVRIHHSAILDRLPLDAVEDEDDPHDQGGDGAPAHDPVHVGQEPRHLLHALRKLVHSEYPSNGNSLEIDNIINRQRYIRHE